MFCQPPPKRNTVSHGSFVLRFCRKKWTLVSCGVWGLWKAARVLAELVQQEDGSCLGHGFRLSLWKAAFEPPVSSLKNPFSLSSPRKRLVPTPLLPLSVLQKAAILCRSYCTWIVLAPWALPSLGHKSGMRGWVGPRRQPTPPIHNYNKSPISYQASKVTSIFHMHHFNESCIQPPR